MSRLIYKYFSDDELLRISNKIRQYEKLTAGEICVSIKEHKRLLNKFTPLKKLAEKEFLRLGLGNTRDKTGILIYVLLEDKQFFILADSAINDLVPENTWDVIKDDMQLNFRKGMFAKGMISGVEQVGKILASHFPVKPDDTNELPDRVIIS